jgi:hypothetical protein
VHWTCPCNADEQSDHTAIEHCCQHAHEQSTDGKRDRTVALNVDVEELDDLKRSLESKSRHESIQINNIAHLVEHCWDLSLLALQAGSHQYLLQIL